MSADTTAPRGSGPFLPPPAVEGPEAHFLFRIAEVHRLAAEAYAELEARAVELERTEDAAHYRALKLDEQRLLLEVFHG